MLQCFLVQLSWDVHPIILPCTLLLLLLPVTHYKVSNRGLLAKPSKFNFCFRLVLYGHSRDRSQNDPLQTCNPFIRVRHLSPPLIEKQAVLKFMRWQAKQRRLSAWGLG